MIFEVCTTMKIHVRPLSVTARVLSGNWWPAFRRDLSYPSSRFGGTYAFIF